MQINHQNKLFVILIICATLNSFCNADHRRRPKTQLIPLTTDSLLLSRCYSQCYRHRRKICEDKCIMEAFQSTRYKKPGDCPDDVFLEQTNQQCNQNCNGSDYTCPGINKCCKSYSCGMICEEPTNLENIEDLVPIPKFVELIANLFNVKTATVQWDMPVIMSEKSLIVYSVESRSHIGKDFDENEMSSYKMHLPLTHYVESYSNFKR